MRVQEQIFLPAAPESAYDRSLQRALVPLFTTVAMKLNQLAAGQASGKDDLRAAAPTTGRWQQGDQIANVAPTELGPALSRYVLLGWVCVAGGSPGTWREMRTLTGN